MCIDVHPICHLIANVFEAASAATKAAGQIEARAWRPLCIMHTIVVVVVVLFIVVAARAVLHRSFVSLLSRACCLLPPRRFSSFLSLPFSSFLFLPPCSRRCLARRHFRCLRCARSRACITSPRKREQRYSVFQPPLMASAIPLVKNWRDFKKCLQFQRDHARNFLARRDETVCVLLGR